MIKPILSGYQDAYIDFLANPTESRTQEQFCTDWNVSWSGLYVWRTKNYDFVYAEADKRRQQYKSQLREKAFKALSKRLEKSDKAIEMALTITGDLDNKAPNEHFHFMGPDEKREKAYDYLKGLSKGQKALPAPRTEGGTDGLLREQGALPGPSNG